MTPGLNARDVLAAFGCALAAALLCSLRVGLAQGNPATFAMLSLFAVPIALGATALVLLPALVAMKAWRCRRASGYVAVPAAVVLAVSLAPMLISGSTSHLRIDGKLLIENGHAVWANFGWIVFFNMEPALWAGLAGLAYWWLRVRTDAVLQKRSS